jgi:diaminopimelate decarboxylase
VNALARELIDRFFASSEGRLRIGALGIQELARQHGTPLYVYDAALIRRQLCSLREWLPPRFDLYYSVKANPNPAIIRCCVADGAGAEIASAAEFLRARRAGCPAERILFAGPGKSEADLALVVDQGIGAIHVESEQEIEALDLIAEARHVEVRVAVRLNPGTAAGGGALRMGGEATPFGFDEERLPEVVAAVRRRPTLRLIGIHVYLGTQVLQAEVLVGQWRHTVSLAARCAEITGEPIETIDLGGGLGIPYYLGEPSLDLSVLHRGAAALVAEIDSNPLLATARIILEPGRFLVGPAGIYLARVLATKRSRGTDFLVLDGGMHHHLAASGNLGQALRRDFPIVNASRLDPAPEREYRVVGPLCTPLDTLGRKVLLPETRRGDILAVLQSGAYGFSASPVGFLSHPTPAEILVDGDTARCIRPRGTFEDPHAKLP